MPFIFTEQSLHYYKVVIRLLINIIISVLAIIIITNIIKFIGQSIV